MERSEALKIAKLAYKEICQGIEDSCGILEELHGIDVDCRLPDYIWVDDFEFDMVDIEGKK